MIKKKFHLINDSRTQTKLHQSLRNDEKSGKLLRLILKVEKDLMKALEKPIGLGKQVTSIQSAFDILDMCLSELRSLLDLEPSIELLFESIHKLYHSLLYKTIQLFLEKVYFYIRKHQGLTDDPGLAEAERKRESKNDWIRATGMIMKEAVHLSSLESDEERLELMLMNKRKTLLNSRSSCAYETLQHFLSKKEIRKSKTHVELESVFMKDLEDKYTVSEITSRINPALQIGKVLPWSKTTQIESSFTSSESEESEIEDANMRFATQGTIIERGILVSVGTEPDVSIFNIHISATIIESLKEEIQRLIDEREILRANAQTLEKRIEREHKDFRNEAEITAYENIALSQSIENLKLELEFFKKDSQTLKETIERKKGKILSLKESLLIEREKGRIKGEKKVRVEVAAPPSSIYADYQRLISDKKLNDDKLDILVRRSSTQEISLQKSLSLNARLTLQMQEAGDEACKANKRISELEVELADLKEGRKVVMIDKTFQVDNVHSSEYVMRMVEHSLATKTRSTKSSKVLAIKKTYGRTSLQTKGSVVLLSSPKDNSNLANSLDMSDSQENSSKGKIMLDVPSNPTTYRKTKTFNENGLARPSLSLENPYIPSPSLFSPITTSFANFIKDEKLISNKDSGLIEAIEVLIRQASMSQKIEIRDSLLKLLNGSTNEEDKENSPKSIEAFMIKKEESIAILQTSRKEVSKTIVKPAKEQKDNYFFSNSTASKSGHQRLPSNQTEIIGQKKETRVNHKYSKSTANVNSTNYLENPLMKARVKPNSDQLQWNLKKRKNSLAKLVSHSNPPIHHSELLVNELNPETITSFHNAFSSKNTSIIEFLGDLIIPSKKNTAILHQQLHSSIVDKENFTKILQNLISHHKSECGDMCSHLLAFYTKSREMNQNKNRGKPFLSPHIRLITRLPNL